MDACFSGSTLSLVGLLLSALTGAIGLLFRSLMAAKDAQIAALTVDKDAQITALTKQNEKYIDGWVKSISAGKSVAQAATRAIDIAVHERER